MLELHPIQMFATVSKVKGYLFEFFSEWRNVLRAMFATFSVRNVLTLQHAPEINHPVLKSYRLKLDEFNLTIKTIKKA